MKRMSRNAGLPGKILEDLNFDRLCDRFLELRGPTGVPAILRFGMWPSPQLKDQGTYYVSYK